MMLGDLLARFTDDDVAAEAILELDDLGLLAALHERALSSGVGLGEYAAGAVRRYTSDASDEEWLGLLGDMSRARDPGIACLKRALNHAVAHMPASGS